MRKLSALISAVIAVLAITIQAQSQARATMKLSGQWQVKFVLVETGEKNLLLRSQDNGSGTFTMLDTGPDNKPVPTPLPVAWAQTTNDRLSFSGEVEMPFGTCCREIGTLIFKGKFSSNDSIAGKVIFIGSTTDEESVIGFRSLLGTFTAKRVQG